MKRCPTCGAVSASDDRFCEADGSALVDAPAPASPERACPACGVGAVEDDGFCSSCGRRAPSSRPSPAHMVPGAPLAGGRVIAARSADEVLVALRQGERDGETVLVALGDAHTHAIDREADALERLGGHGAFPRLVARGKDDAGRPFVALAPPPAGARPLGEAGPRLDLEGAFAVLRELLDAAHAVERLGLAWELQRDDVHLRADGAVYLARLRAPRKLGTGERLDARAVVESVGASFVPVPALDGPSRAFRLLLPHVPIPGDAGTSIEEVRAELAAIERVGPPPSGGAGVEGVCDPGLRRPHNEDAMASAQGVTLGEPWTVLVVCDGVSSSTHAEQASAVASKTASDALAHFARSGDIAHEAGAMAVAAAIRAAHLAVCAQGIDASGGDPPGTTIVAGLLWRRRLTVGWVGDSRAYWVSDQGAELLTHDHSWANEAIARGEVTEVEAALSPLAHALTRCLGPLEVVDQEAAGGAGRARIQEVTPDVRARDLPGPGWIVLCSDGFWNYFSPAREVAALVRGAGPGAGPGRVARRLVNQALLRGGQDNTTVLVHRHS